MHADQARLPAARQAQRQAMHKAAALLHLMTAQVGRLLYKPHQRKGIRCTTSKTVMRGKAVWAVCKRERGQCANETTRRTIRKGFGCAAQSGPPSFSAQGVAARGWKRAGSARGGASMRGAQGPGSAKCGTCHQPVWLYARLMLCASRHRQQAASNIMHCAVPRRTVPCRAVRVRPGSGVCCAPLIPHSNAAVRLLCAYSNTTVRLLCTITRSCRCQRTALASTVRSRSRPCGGKRDAQTNFQLVDNRPQQCAAGEAGPALPTESLQGWATIHQFHRFEHAHLADHVLDAVAVHHNLKWQHPTKELHSNFLPCGPCP